MTELYYVEDDAQIARIVKEYLEQRDFQVNVCASMEEAKRALQDHMPALVLVDWNMPDGQGDSLCRWIRASWRELPIIFLTVRGDARDIVFAFENGADDYVVKPFELEVLHSRITALLRRAGNTSGRYLTCDHISVDQNRMTVACGAEEVHVTAAEYQLLLFLMKNKGRTVTRTMLLEQVWDAHGNYVTDNTLTVTMKRLREKLHRPHCLKTVRSVGYRMEDTL